MESKVGAVLRIKRAVVTTGDEFHERILLRGLSLEIHERERLLIEWDCPDERSALMALLSGQARIVSGEIEGVRRFRSSWHLLGRIAEACGKVGKFPPDIAVLEIGSGTLHLRERLAAHGDASAIIAFGPAIVSYDRGIFDRTLHLSKGRIMHNSVGDDHGRR